MLDTASPASILIVDDDSICVMSLQRGLRKAGVSLPTDVAKDGQVAIDKLRAIAKEKGRLPPLIVSLDLNMPRMGGIELLTQLRADPLLKRAIVLVYTTSDAPNDLGACYDRNVAGFMVKDRDPTQVATLIGQFANCVTFPA